MRRPKRAPTEPGLPTSPGAPEPISVAVADLEAAMAPVPVEGPVVLEPAYPAKNGTELQVRATYPAARRDRDRLRKKQGM
jgi:hypothetical protein